MLKISIDEIISRIKEKTGLQQEAIEKKINEKVEELSGLVSKNGAAHIVANDFGIHLFKASGEGLLKIKNIVPGLKVASLIGRVLRVYPVKNFKTRKGIEGKVCSILVGDSTGRIRIVFWDVHQIELIENKKLKEGDIIKITNCYVKEGINGVEIHARSLSKIDINPDVKEAKDIPPLSKLLSISKEVNIKDIKEEGIYKIRGAIVNILENNMFFEVCPTCGKRVYNNTCPEHGEVVLKHSMFISTIFDDGSDNMRIVFFGRQAEQILGMSSEEAYKLAKEHNNFFYPIQSKKNELLGKELIVEGKVSKNSFSGELEMIGRNITVPNPVVEAEKIAKEADLKNE